MTNEKNKIMYKEVYSFLLLVPNEYFNKIPSNVIENIKNNTDNLIYDNLNGDMLPESKALIISIIRRYFDNKEINQKIYDYINNYNVLINQKYSYDNIFKREKNENISNNMMLTTIEHKSAIQKIIIKIKKLFNKK